MGRYALDFELAVEAVNREKANEKRAELEKLLKSQFVEGELLHIYSFSDADDEEDDEQDDTE